MGVETAKLLRDAKAILERDGWCQRVMRNDQGARCSMGALCEAAIYLPPDNKFGMEALVDSARDAIEAVDDFAKANGIVHWNDRIGQSRTNVLDTFERAAKHAETIPQYS